MIEPMDYAAEMARVERVIEAAKRLMREDMRFRQLVNGTVAHAMNDHGPIDPDNAGEAAADIACAAVALVLARVYTEDAEVATLKLERDHYRKLAEEALTLAPPRMIFAA